MAQPAGGPAAHEATAAAGPPLDLADPEEAGGAAAGQAAATEGHGDAGLGELLWGQGWEARLQRCHARIVQTLAGRAAGAAAQEAPA